MSVNSLENLLNQMQGRSVIHGWGAVVAFSRAQLNRLLEEQYLSWLHEGRIVPPISGVVYIDDQTESMRLDKLLLGKPVLSFASSSLNQSMVTLTMNIVGGNYTAMSRPRGGAERVISSFNITEALGYKIEMKISLHGIDGEVDQRGRVTFDMASDLSMTCNLGEGNGVQRKVAAFIQGQLAALPVDTRTFELGLFDFTGHNPLSPTRFYIRTQKAPAGSANPDDGAVLLFVCLKIKDENGDGFPVDGSGFPYLIPDDQAAGKDLYSAAVVLNHEFIELLDDVQLDVLTNLLLPGANLFVESPKGRHTPHDLLVLGNLKPSVENVTIEPAFTSVKAGKTQTFTARKSDGSIVGAQWSVSNPLSPLSVGSITPTRGEYRAPALSSMGNEQQPVVVTAAYAIGGKQRTSSALVFGTSESMSISPRVCTSGVGAGAAPIKLTASTLGGGKLQWPTLAPSEGTLEVIDDNHAIYKPPLDLIKPLDIQKITVTDPVTKETIEATIVLMRSAHTLPVDPPYVEAITATQPIQFYTDLDPQDERWEVIGEGEVKEGLFIPPAQPTSRISVVRCSYLVNGTARASGLSIIQLSEREQPVPNWEQLDGFSITTTGEVGRCASNGYQQIPVMIRIETKPVTINGQLVYIPVSDAQLSTLRLVDRASNTLVPFVGVAQEGIEYGSGVNWATNKKRNRFRLYSSTSVSTDEEHSLTPPAPNNNGVRYRELWVHLAVEGSRTFYALFDSHQGTQSSIDSSGDGSQVIVEGIRPLPPALGFYEFKRQRVWQDPDGRDEPIEGSNEIDYFSYYRRSIDYWRLSYRRLGMYPVLFATSVIENNLSTIQWESELIIERYFSHTGYAFNSANYEDRDSPAPKGLSFDPYFWRLAKHSRRKLDTSFAANKQPSPGEMIVSLHRLDNLMYWYDGLAGGDAYKLYRKHLDPGMRFFLIDEEGNRHSLSVAFESGTIEDSRNKLILSLA
ncbi:hypothetical protein H7698_16380 [Pseudomonas sp. p50]|uniref:hypothetical protein n=1 Tax=Pseudomonas sp. p50(2008) TaxID=2816832 RepID=UPI001889F5DC|nr:hypothetical protein [Pseudomonas sp. p50(2008)]MBF4557655.1 hypothetical protein [Pseudomonas sp. p50(2008)]